MPEPSPQTARYQWATTGDINAFFGLVLDNIAGLFLILSLLVGIFGFPADFVVTRMIPGTAIGVFVGDLCFFYMAFRLAKRTGRSDVTAMPLGLDTPSVFGITIFVLGAAFNEGLNRLSLSPDEAAMRAWHIGIFCMVAGGLFKLICSFGSELARRVIPRAGLLGSLTAIALVVISFLPLLDIMSVPAVGMVALTIVLVSLLGQVPMPWNVPGAVVALIVSGTIYYIMLGAGLLPIEPPEAMETTIGSVNWLSAFSFEWLKVWPAGVNYLPIALPFALATVVGGIDCTESAAAVGDSYKTNRVIAVEAVATMLAGFCGGVIQTTPYIGHPAYKAMGGRAAYTLATAVFILILGLFGLFTFVYAYLPKATVYPLLIFVGLEITAQSFFATPQRHYPAVAFACVPALAFLAVHFANRIFGDGAMFAAGISAADLQNPELRLNLQTANLLANGFIISSLLWASALSFAIDRRLKAAGTCFSIAALLTAFGVIHSPSNKIFLPLSPEQMPQLDPAWLLASVDASKVWGLFAGYALTAIVLFIWSAFTPPLHLDESLPHANLAH